VTGGSVSLGLVGGKPRPLVPVGVLVLVCRLSVAGGDRFCGQRAAPMVSAGCRRSGCGCCGWRVCQASCAVWS
jgi:hypothetical protein